MRPSANRNFTASMKQKIALLLKHMDPADARQSESFMRAIAEKSLLVAETLRREREQENNR